MFRTGIARTGNKKFIRYRDAVGALILARVVKIKKSDSHDSLSGFPVSAFRTKKFVVGGFARYRGMGTRLYKVVSIEPFTLQRFGETSWGCFVPAKKPRKFQPIAGMSTGPYFYEPVELYRELKPSIP